MSPAERDEFLVSPRTAVISTLSRDGTIHSVPVWFTWNGGVFRVLTGRGSAKHRNAERTGRATVCIDQRDGSFRYVTAEGPVRIVDPITAEDRLTLWTHYRGAEEARRTVAGGGHEGMVMLEISPERWLG